MTTVYSRPQIAQVIQPKRVIAAMEGAFVAYSNGEAVIPPVGQLDFEDPPGDCHIKYGFLKLFALATIRAVDSLSQCSKFGDSSFALEQGLIEMRDLVELGQVIQDASLRRRSERDISIADLTGAAVQDMAIAELALQGLR